MKETVIQKLDHSIPTDQFSFDSVDQQVRELLGQLRHSIQLGATVAEDRMVRKERCLDLSNHIPNR